MATVIRTMVTDDASTLRGLLNAVRDALGPTCADATHEALPGLVAEVVACDAAMHREVDARGERLRALRAVAQAAAALVLWHDANTPDGYLNDADGRMWSMIDALRAAGYEMPTGTLTGATREEMAAEVAHLEARRGALLAEVDRLHALDRDAGVVIEDLRKMLAEANAAVATARADGAREMRERAAAVAERCADERGGTQARLFAAGDVDGAMVVGIKGGEATRIEEAIRALPLPEASAPQPVAWGAMPTAAEVEARCEGRAEPARGAPWMRRHADTSGDFVEVVYLRAIDGLMYFREPDGAVWYLMRAVHESSRWRPIDDDGAAAQEVARG